MKSIDCNFVYYIYLRKKINQITTFIFIAVHLIYLIPRWRKCDFAFRDMYWKFKTYYSWKLIFNSNPSEIFIFFWEVIPFVNELSFLSLLLFFFLKGKKLICHMLFGNTFIFSFFFSFLLKREVNDLHVFHCIFLLR